MDRLTLLLVQTFLLAVAFSSGQGTILKCYNCMTMSNKDCADPFLKTSLAPTECDLQKVQQAGASLANTFTSIATKFGFDVPQGGAVGADAHWTCMKIDYLDDKGKNYTVRGCRLPDSEIPNLDLCKKPPPGMQITYCASCEGDGCNGAGRLDAFSSLAFLLLPCLLALTA